MKNKKLIMIFVIIIIVVSARICVSAETYEDDKLNRLVKVVHDDGSYTDESGKIIDNYINNDYSCHLPHDSEGDLFHLFASVEQLATMLKAKSETEHKTKEFLKSTISDISHQLKTPLAALMMYQEIIEAEPDNTETVKKFSQKTGTALKRIEQLILSMLKIARLDTGNILFDKRTCLIQELVKNAISELTIRATQEKKQIIVNGTSNQVIMCDMDWTSEAIGNLVKNALEDYLGKYTNYDTNFSF